jgi:hypothetical protein
MPLMNNVTADGTALPESYKSITCMWYPTKRTALQYFCLCHSWLRESFLAIIYGGENPGNTRHSCAISINRNNKLHEADRPSNLLESIKASGAEGVVDYLRWNEHH